VADGEGSVGGDIFFHIEKWGPPAALSALLFLLGVFFFRQIFVSRSDEKIGDKGGFGFVRFIGSLNLGMNG
jgi:hypothetical protein